LERNSSRIKKEYHYLKYDDRIQKER